MSSRVTQILLGLSLLLNAFVLVGFVFSSWIEPPHSPFAAGRPPAPPPGPRLGNPLEALSHDLRLDDAQKKAVQPVVDEYANGRRDRWRDIGKIREEMAAELQKPNFDWAKIDALIDQITALRVDQQKQNLRAVEQMANKLPADKRAELHKILGERYGGQAWRPGNAPPGGPRPPRPPQ
ncbi:MAG: periplasmic heavy metal sensor [Reyranella sp.]|uniref:Spy/CpxP family protein refolding chaperone n=1 Tax=Reyranella sp. TaxID=1929291 RepID=UPI001ACBA087|nr:periplasmic heavy metal sensor [Reyranella sp.]MBN9091459.1 periplasmic heavy metal sensor [Reyranella sp.]